MGVRCCVDSDDVFRYAYCANPWRDRFWYFVHFLVGGEFAIQASAFPSMKQSSLLKFQSSAFAVIPGEDEETNPGIYGKALAVWLGERLRAVDVCAGTVIGEDCGWCVPVKSPPYSLYVACPNDHTISTSARLDDMNVSTEERVAIFSWTDLRLRFYVGGALCSFLAAIVLSIWPRPRRE